MCERMEFPKTFEEFAKVYGFKDKEEVYTNGSDLIQIFRVKQWLEHIREQEPTRMIDKSNFSREQYKVDLQCAYDCGKSILAKVKAEIENDWQLKDFPSSPFSCGLRRAIEIIDKYKAESEKKE